MNPEERALLKKLVDQARRAKIGAEPRLCPECGKDRVDSKSQTIGCKTCSNRITRRIRRSSPEYSKLESERRKLRYKTDEEFREHKRQYLREWRAKRKQAS